SVVRPLVRRPEVPLSEFDLCQERRCIARDSLVAALRRGAFSLLRALDRGVELAAGPFDLCLKVLEMRQPDAHDGSLEAGSALIQCALRLVESIALEVDFGEGEHGEPSVAR